MSIAIVPTKNTMGVRTLMGYAIQPVDRAPAEPGPRAANHPVRALLGRMGTVMDPLTFAPNRPTNEIVHLVSPPQQAPAGSSSMPSQAPTSAVVSSYTDLSASIAPSVAQSVAPAPNPTAIATVAPASAPGYTVVQSGAQNPDYVGEIETWLTNTDLLASIIPGIAVPNWIPAVAIVGGLMYMMSTKKR